MFDTWNELIISYIFDQVQFMYWRDRHEVSCPDVYYQQTLGV